MLLQELNNVLYCAENLLDKCKKFHTHFCKFNMMGSGIMAHKIGGTLDDHKKDVQKDHVNDYSSAAVIQRHLILQCPIIHRRTM